MSGLHAVSSSDDVKPPLGLKQLSSHSPGPMLSQKRLCSICGDRSSGEDTSHTRFNDRLLEAQKPENIFCLSLFLFRKALWGLQLRGL